MITADQIRELASFAGNCPRDDLERAGIIQAGKAGDRKWVRFNTDLSTFILKLTGDQLEAFTSLANRFGNPDRALDMRRDEQMAVL